MVFLRVFYRMILRRSRICSSIGIILSTLIFSALFCGYVILGPTDDVSNDKNDDIYIILAENHQQKEFIDKRGIHVIVGQYIGPNVQSDAINNLSEEVLNTNNYRPIAGQGDQGLPVYISEIEATKAKMLYQINKFNLVASDKISVNRTLPDPRKQSCRQILYDIDSLPSTSIIIVFHNEAWSTLLRTIHSVINRSPKRLINEIILVDDASERSFLKQPLETYLQDLSRTSKLAIHLIRSNIRIGLIKARTLGVARAKGKVLTFLDAHIEATEGWLPPLLQRVAENHKAIVCPIIDIIHEQTFAYSKTFDLHWGGINWNLHFRWFAMGEKQYKENGKLNAKYVRKHLQENLFAVNSSAENDQINELSHADEQLERKKPLRSLVMPFKSPVMAGGLFSVWTQFFHELGAYDEQMSIWGGENVELSLRAWCCGGRVEIHPCSHVAHLFRKSSPYTFPGGVSQVLSNNLARVVHVWMPPAYRTFFYMLNPLLRRSLIGELNLHSDPLLMARQGRLQEINELFSNQTLLNLKFPRLNERQALKERLQCRDFDWFLQNVWPQHFFPRGNRFFGQFSIVTGGRQKCIQRPNDELGRTLGSLQLLDCQHSAYAPQLFVHSEQGYLMTDESLCIDVRQPCSLGVQLMLMPCAEQHRQVFRIEKNKAGARIRHEKCDLCIGPNTKGGLALQGCDSAQLELLNVTWWNQTTKLPLLQKKYNVF